MPPKKEAKEKQVKGDEAEEMVLQYMESVNRPYASTDVSANLKNKVPKAAAQKVLQALADKGSLTMKPYGKQTIFVYNQASLPVLSSDEMKEIDAQLVEAQDEVAERKKVASALDKEMSSEEALPKTKDLARAIEQAKAENDSILNQLLPFRSKGEAAAKPMSAEETAAIDAEFTKWRKYWVDRRKLYKSLMDTLVESGIGHAQDVEESQGIDQDDEEAIEVDKGEFSRPAPHRRPQSAPRAKPPAPASVPTAAKPAPATKAAPVKKPARAPKRPVSIELERPSLSPTTVSSEEEEVVEVPKPKRAKAIA